MRYYVTLDGEEHTLEVSRQPSGGHRVVVPGAPDAEPVEVAATPTRLGVVVSLGGRHIEVVFDAAPPEAIVQAGRRHFAVRIESERLIELIDGLVKLPFSQIPLTERSQ